MRRAYRHMRSRLAAVLILFLGAVGVGGCKTSQKVKTPIKQERQRLNRLDSIPERYPEAIAMYGTPYRRYEPMWQIPNKPLKEPNKEEK